MPPYPKRLKTFDAYSVFILDLFSTALWRVALVPAVLPFPNAVWPFLYAAFRHQYYIVFRTDVLLNLIA